MKQHNESPHRNPAAAVVVGTDGSPGSRAAVCWAARAAVDRGRALHIVHCTGPVSDRTPHSAYDAFIFATMQDIRGAAERVLATAREQASTATPGVTVTTELVSGGSPAHALIAASEHAHLIVLGVASEAGAISHLGSTLLAVTSHARGAVVVVRGTDRTSGPVVVGVDGSTISEPAIAAAFSEASQRGTELLAVHGWSDLSGGGFADSSFLSPPIDDIATADAALLSERLAGWTEQFPDVVVRREIVVYGVRERLTELSRSAGLLVVGSRGRGGFRGLLLGSTSNFLVQHADCPVMVVHPG
ncbi:universal stress protein [Nocardia sp. NPDC003979]